MPFCTNCGKPVKESFKFCQSCGMPVEAAANTGVAAAPPQTAENTPTASVPAGTSGSPVFSGESIKSIIPSLIMPKSFGRSDTYNLIVTERRSIFAKLTGEIMKEVVKARRDKAEAEGKGFFGKWATQMKGDSYTDHYRSLTPDQVLNETEGNFAIENSMIRKVKTSMHSGDEDSPSECNIEIETVTGKLKFQAQYNAEKMFKQVYG